MKLFINLIRWARAVSLLVVASVVQAKTITVMQDGSGEFQQLQPALDAVASGGTLYIGPGEFVGFNTVCFRLKGRGSLSKNSPFPSHHKTSIEYKPTLKNQRAPVWLFY